MAEVQTHNLAGEMTQVFIEFVMQQAQNAMLFLGQVPDRSGQVQVNLPYAKMFIDQLIVIRERTAGNLQGDEKKVIESAVEELSAAYVEVAQMVRARNVGGEAPPELLRTGESVPAEAAPAPAPAPVVPPPAAAAAAPAPAAEAPAPPASEPEPEVSRKRFTKSYGP